MRIHNASLIPCRAISLLLLKTHYTHWKSNIIWLESTPTLTEKKLHETKISTYEHCLVFCIGRLPYWALCPLAVTVLDPRINQKRLIKWQSLLCLSLHCTLDCSFTLFPTFIMTSTLHTEPPRQQIRTVLWVVFLMLSNLHKTYNCMHDLPIQYTRYAIE